MERLKYASIPKNTEYRRGEWSHKMPGKIGRAVGAKAVLVTVGDHVRIVAFKHLIS